MAKKRKYYDLEPDDEFDNPLDEFYLEETNIKEDCGKQNAIVGQALYQRGLVSQRSFDGRAIHATIQDGNSNIPVVYGLDDFSFTCSDQKHLRLEEFACEHIAALMYAYVREPESFLPQNIGGFIDLLNKNPQARDQLAANRSIGQENTWPIAEHADRRARGAIELAAQRDAGTSRCRGCARPHSRRRIKIADAPIVAGTIARDRQAARLAPRIIEQLQRIDHHRDSILARDGAAAGGVFARRRTTPAS